MDDREESSNKKREEDRELMKLLQNSENTITGLQNYIEALSERYAEQSLQVETWSRISESNDKVEMAAVAKMLNYKGIGRNKLFKILRDENILRYNNEPYQRFVDAEYFSVIEQEVTTAYDNTLVNRKTIVTQKGIDYIRKALTKLGYEDGSR
jgi:anti-repressor protein